MILVLCISLFLNILISNSVFWEPEIPVPGGEITIYYNTLEGTLPNNTFPVYVHLGYDGWVDVEDYAMSYSPANGSGWWKYSYQIPEDAETIDFVFTDLNDNWDNNGGIGIDWHISMNYYWSPFNPTPNDDFEIVLNNIDQGGHIIWTVDAGKGHTTPIQDYWPENSYLDNGSVYSPLVFLTDTSASIDFTSLQSGEQVVSSIKFKILWDDGTYDIGSNGQVIFYDIYFDYMLGENDPEIEIISPEQNEQIIGDVEIYCQGSADSVELWLDGNLLTTQNTDEFSYLWQPPDGLFGDLTLTAKAISGDGRVSFSFTEFNLQYEIINEQVPLGSLDGVNLNSNDVIITLYAPEKDYVAIKGSWNTEYPNGEIMKLSDDDFWWYQTTLPNGTYTYQYNLNGEKYIADPWSKDVEWKDPLTGQESSNFQNALTLFTIGEDEYEWTDSEYVRPQMEDLIIYEMHVGDFLGIEGQVGTYSYIIEKIESGYFADLGVNALELMPINEFEGDYSWGYNTSYGLAPESTYGTPNELRDLINVAHEHGLAVLLDVVYNHLWGSSPLFQLYQPIDNYEWDEHDFDACPYFGDAPSQWGYKLEHWHDLNGREYRGWKYVTDSLEHWVTEYHIDGFRFDYVEGIGWDGDFNGASFYADFLDDIDPSLIIIAETDNPTQINNTDFDSGWDYSYHHNLFDNILDIYFDINNITNHINAYSQGYGFVTGPINYIESHDESRLIYQSTQFQGHSLEEACKRSKVGATILFTSHGVPMIYSGQEFAQNAPTRDSGGFPIPQPLQWENLEDDITIDLNQHYKNLTSLRSDFDILKQPPLEVKYTNNGNKVLVYWRADNEQEVVVAVNLDTIEHSLDLEFPNSGSWYNYLNGDELNIDTNWFGGFVLAPLTSYVFVPNNSPQCNLGDINQDSVINVIDIVALVNYILGGSLSEGGICASDLNGDSIVNVIDIVALVNAILSL